MLKVKKAWVVRGGIALTIAVIAGLVMVMGAMLAGTGVVIQTPALAVLDIYIDRNNNGQNDADEYLGKFPVYDGNKGITFTWDAYPFADDEHGAYRVALWQNTNPFGAPVWVEKKIAHHHTSDPHPNTFTMGSFGSPNAVCLVCPSMFVVQPETWTQVYNSQRQTYEYQYTLLDQMQTSEQFFFQLTFPSVDTPFVATMPPVLTCNQTPTTLCEEHICGVGNTGCLEWCVPWLTGATRFNFTTCTCGLTENECQGAVHTGLCVCQSEIPSDQ